MLPLLVDAALREAALAAEPAASEGALCGARPQAGGGAGAGEEEEAEASRAAGGRPPTTTSGEGVLARGAPPPGRASGRVEASAPDPLATETTSKASS
mmetsp:Transcript_105555/g.273314  ORF Transcript_105555/g.273314 Transcript_105555/m.273314 type:complete len:98 (+) Transcript_105555:873-1166(+)